MVWEGRGLQGLAGWGGALSPPLYLQGQGGVVQDDDPLHHHLGLTGGLAHSCSLDHVVCLQVLLILSIRDLHGIIYFWREKPGEQSEREWGWLLKPSSELMPSQVSVRWLRISVAQGLTEPSLGQVLWETSLSFAGSRAGTRARPGLWLARQTPRRMSSQGLKHPLHPENVRGQISFEGAEEEYEC